MARAAFTEYERLTRALAIYRDALRRHIKNVLDDDPPGFDPYSAERDWYARKVLPHLPGYLQEEVNYSRSRRQPGSREWRGESMLDIPQFMFTIRNNPSFRSLAADELVEPLKQVYEARNLWAHPPHHGFSRAEVDRIIQQCAEVLEVCDRAAAADVTSLLNVDMKQEEQDDIESTLMEELIRIEDRQLQPEAIQQILEATTTNSRQYQELKQSFKKVEETVTNLTNIIEADQAERNQPILDKLLTPGTTKELKQKLQTLLNL